MSKMDLRDFFTFRKLLLLTLMTLFFIPASEGIENPQLQKVDKNEMGMEPLFTMVHIFLGDIVQTKNISNSFINLTTVFVDGDFDEDTLTDWNKWSEYLIGYAVCAGIGLFFIIVMPFAGFIFCCCRLCGKCGGRKRHSERKYSKCKRRTFCTFLIVFNTLALAGVVCAFICNSLIYKNLKNDQSEGLVGHLQNSLTQIKTFADDAVQNVSTKALKTVKDVSDKVIEDIDATGTNAIDDALKSLNASAYLDQAKEISKDVNKTKDLLETVNTLLKSLINDTQELQTNLTNIKDSIKGAYCDSPSSCIFPDEDNYNTTIDFSKLGDLSEEADKVSTAMDMDKYIKKAEDSIKNAQTKVKQEISSQTNSARSSIEKVNKSVTDGITDLRLKKDDAVTYLKDANNELNDADHTIKDHADIIYYAGIGICSAFLLIVVLYYFGILYGLCGERPGDGAPCCNKGAGSNFLMAGVSFTFIFSWLLMLLCLIMFVIGGLSYTEVCRYFDDHDPMEIKVFDNTLNNGLDLSGAIFKNKSAKFSISNSLKECQENKAVYSAFDLRNVVDLDNITKLDSFKDELNNIKKNIPAFDNITIIDPQLKSSLTKFSNAGLENFNFTKFINETEKQITFVDLRELANKTRKLAGVSTSPSSKDQIDANADKLDELAEHVIPELTANMEKLKKALISLQNDNSSYTGPIEKLIAGLENSQDYFNANKSTLIKQAITELADGIYDFTSRKVDSLKNEIETNVGHCAPLSEAFFSLTDSACVLVVDPMNGLWFSFGWCLFFFILCLFFAIPLTSLYRCEHKYEKEFDDPNYAMYGGPNPDTIPLTSVERMGGQRPHGYPQHYQSGMANSAYSPEAKPYAAAPPPYRESMSQGGIAAYAYPSPPDYHGHQHHDLSSAYPALHKDNRNHHQHNPRHMDSGNYPY